MNHLTVGELREIAEYILQGIECYDDDDIISTRINNYGLDDYDNTLETRYGFLQLDNISIEDEDEEDSE